MDFYGTPTDRSPNNDVGTSLYEFKTTTEGLTHIHTINGTIIATRMTTTRTRGHAAEEEKWRVESNRSAARDKLVFRAF